MFSVLAHCLMPHRTEVDPNYVKNEKGDYEIVINTTACDAQGECYCVPKGPSTLSSKQQGLGQVHVGMPGQSYAQQSYALHKVQP